MATILFPYRPVFRRCRGGYICRNDGGVAACEENMSSENEMELHAVTTNNIPRLTREYAAGGLRRRRHLVLGVE